MILIDKILAGQPTEAFAHVGAKEVNQRTQRFGNVLFHALLMSEHHNVDAWAALIQKIDQLAPHLKNEKNYAGQTPRNVAETSSNPKMKYVFSKFAWVIFHPNKTAFAIAFIFCIGAFLCVWFNVHYSIPVGLASGGFGLALGYLFCHHLLKPLQYAPT